GNTLSAHCTFQVLVFSRQDKGKPEQGGDFSLNIKVIRPMEPVPAEKPTDDPAWIHQVKWDGIRLLSYIEGGRTRLYTRGGQERTGAYPELVEAKVAKAGAVVLDGEVVALDSRGVPSFQRVMRRHMRSQRGLGAAIDISVHYVVFDLLHLNGRWLFEVPLLDRQALLQDSVNWDTGVRPCDNHTSGMELFQATKQLGLEGIVSKERNGCYHPHRKHPTWRKIKHFRELDVVVVGVLLKLGRANALLTAAYLDSELAYTGRVATGLSMDELSLFTELALYSQGSSPPLLNRGQLPEREVRWLKIRPAVRIRFMGWTEQGLFRAPVVVGFATRPEEECVIE
ncbi:MAG: hypothetical protein RDU41_04930, partial [Clostridia bacterium]|nr:hypothetical protein [Clostridia bacterium]